MKNGWKNLETEADLQSAIQESFERPVVIFKHSTRCGISAHKFYDMEMDWKSTPEEIAFYYLDLLAYRPISNLVAEQLGVMHQSPQIVILKEGKAIANASHAYATYDFVKKNTVG